MYKLKSHIFLRDPWFSVFTAPTTANSPADFHWLTEGLRECVRHAGALIELNGGIPHTSPLAIRHNRGTWMSHWGSLPLILSLPSATCTLTHSPSLLSGILVASSLPPSELHTTLTHTTVGSHDSKTRILLLMKTIAIICDYFIFIN